MEEPAYDCFVVLWSEQGFNPPLFEYTSKANGSGVSTLEAFEGPVFGGWNCLQETETVLCGSEKGISSAAALNATGVSFVDKKEVKEVEVVSLQALSEGLWCCRLSEKSL